MNNGDGDQTERMCSLTWAFTLLHKKEAYAVCSVRESISLWLYAQDIDIISIYRKIPETAHICLFYYLRHRTGSYISKTGKYELLRVFFGLIDKVSMACAL